MCVALASDRAYLSECSILEEHHAGDCFRLPRCHGRCCWSRLQAALLLAHDLGLWAYYGTAVFFEMVRAGWVACF